jgi:hypothetical protein
MDKQFLKVGDLIFNVANITCIHLNAGEFEKRIHIKTVDCIEGSYSVSKSSPEGKVLIAWVTDPHRCLDVDMIVE